MDGERFVLGSLRVVYAPGGVMPAQDHETKALRQDAPALRSRPRLGWQDAGGAHEAVIDAPLVVGSASGADLVVADSSVSRLHAELDPRPDGLWVRDLGSTNGTFVDGLLVTAARLPPAARIRVGQTTLALLPDSAATPVDLWPDDGLGELVGGSAAMRELYATIVRVAASEAPVLVQGETGTGKELVARAI
ncbi:MAG: FHA domain-containing protein, partial [Polyangiaceae bacterium]